MSVAPRTALRVDLASRREGRLQDSPDRLRSSLAALGVEVGAVRDAAPEPRAGAVLWLQGNPHWYPRTLRELARLPQGRRPFVLAWHSEPLPLPAAAGRRLERPRARELAKIVLRDDRATDPWSNARRLLRLSRASLVDLLVVSSRNSQEYLAEHGVASEFVPLGFDEPDGRELGLTRDLDVLLLADLTVPRRRRIVRHLRRRGVPVVALGDWRDPAFFGESRTRLLNRTKILLNVPRHAGLLSGRTMILGMANKALVVAEPIHRPEPYRPGVHYVSAEIADLPEVLERLLAEPAERAPLVAAAHRFVREELTFTRSVERILARVEERRAP